MNSVEHTDNAIQTNWLPFESLCDNYRTVSLFQLKLNDFTVLPPRARIGSDVFQVFK